MLVQYFDRLKICLDKLDIQVIEAIIQLIKVTKKKKKIIWIIGNGGSATTASHLATDLSKVAGVQAISLTANVGILTAWANDMDFIEIFSRQIDLYIRKEDLLVAISASGNSGNIYRAAQLAQTKGVHVIGLLGFNGGKIKEFCNLAIIVQSENYGRIEDVHLAICHAITEELKKNE